ncbi:cupin domain-containing protein [Rummeliibacillus pycnus]|uniref:cupin domain-containing protein n=1 Tax=Rummeliibacillus pycnus TaxID=101070 RepID=UPI003D2BF053
MYGMYGMYPYPYFNAPYGQGFSEQFTPYEVGYGSMFNSPQSTTHNAPINLSDHGPNPYVVNISEATKQNKPFRTALWTGKHLQLTLMNILDDIGLEIHPHTDQFLRIEEGEGIVRMGKNKNNLDFQRRVKDDDAIFIPAGTWHNVINTGNRPLKLYSIYAPVQHPFGTVHLTKADAEAAEKH